MKVGEHTLGVHHALVLLDLDDDDGHSLATGDRLEMLVAGSLVAELLHRGRIEQRGPKIAIKAGRPASRMLEPVEAQIGGRPTEVLEVLRSVVDGGFRHAIHSDLVGRGVLEVQQKRKWWLFKKSTWPTADPTLERALIAHLRRVAEDPGTEFVPEDSVFALLVAGGLESSVFEEPVDLNTRLRRCPIGAVLREHFGRHSPQFHAN